MQTLYIPVDAVPVYVYFSRITLFFPTMMQNVLVLYRYQQVAATDTHIGYVPSHSRM